MTLGTAIGLPSRAASRVLYLPAVVIAATTGALVWFAVSLLERSGNLGRVLGSGRAELVAPAIVGLVGITLVCERLWPAEPRRVFAKGHVHDAAFLVMHVVAVVPLMTLMSVAFSTLITQHARAIEIPWTAGWLRFPMIVLTFVLMDGANWLAHWADHRFTALWRLHALHHSQEELNVLTSFRAHPLSHLAGFFLAAFPVAVLLGHRGVAPGLVTAYVCFGTLPHANVRWSFGPMGRVLVSPAYHRLHHSYEGSRGFNLGVVLTVWDVLARRARFPEMGGLPCETGLPDRAVRVEQDAAGGHLGVLVLQLAEPFAGARSGR